MLIINNFYPGLKKISFQNPIHSTLHTVAEQLNVILQELSSFQCHSGTILLSDPVFNSMGLADFKSRANVFYWPKLLCISLL